MLVQTNAFDSALTTTARGRVRLPSMPRQLEAGTRGRRMGNGTERLIPSWSMAGVLPFHASRCIRKRKAFAQRSPPVPTPEGASGVGAQCGQNKVVCAPLGLCPERRSVNQAFRCGVHGQCASRLVIGTQVLSSTTSPHETPNPPLLPKLSTNEFLTLQIEKKGSTPKPFDKVLEMKRAGQNEQSARRWCLSGNYFTVSPIIISVAK